MNDQLTFDESQAQAIETLYMTEAALARRRRVLEFAGVGSGQTFLDLGCGPGFLSVEAAEKVGEGGTVDAVDSSESMLAMTGARVEKNSVSGRVKCHASDATELPFPDGRFDAAAIIQVYEYVSDISAALSELYRVLKPGGRFVIVDTDWDTNALESLDRDLNEKIFSVFEGHLAHPTLPRNLGPLLHDAGFEITNVEPIVQYAQGVPDAFANAFTKKIVRDYVIGKDGLTEQHVDDWLMGLDQLASKKGFFWSVTQFFFVGCKL